MLAEDFLLNPEPSYSSFKMNFHSIETLSSEQLQIHLQYQDNLLGSLLNYQIWVITVIYEESHVTLEINAHNGKITEVYGPFSSA